MYIEAENVLSLLPWNTCSARCAHCGPESGPKDKSHIKHEHNLFLIEEAGKLYSKDWCLTLSGGEIFLFYDKLLKYVKHAKKHGGYTTLITNCYWARIEEKALELLKPLVENNLKVLGISLSHFHAEYIKPEYVRNAIKAAKKLKLTCRVRSVASKSGRLSDVLKSIEDANPWFMTVMEMPLVPHGRAANLPKDEFPSGVCPAASMTFNPKGKAMMCCNGGGDLEPLQVGDIYENSLAELEYQFASDPTLNLLRNKGPKECLKYLSKKDAEKVMQEKYINECHLCIELFKGKKGKELKNIIESDFINSMSDFSKKFTDKITTHNRVDG